MRETQVVRVFKDGSSTKYVEPSLDSDERSQRSLDADSEEQQERSASLKPISPTQPSTIANDSLFQWVAQERFPKFVKVFWVV